MKARERKSETGYDFKLNNNYEYKLLSDDRVAGRQTFVVEVTANDRERYSYRVWIDKETKLLLKSMSLDAGGLPVEQVMFTDIRFDHDITIDNVTDKLERLEYQAQNYVEPASVSYLTEKKVRFDLLPKGYRKISEMNHHMPTIAEPVRHIFLSDGIASISIYVQFGYKASEIIPVGYAKLGSITAYERRTDTDLITVMGDVPAQTVRAVAYSVNIEN
jgi:sigma-E factor negative regulatory protein RseB